MPGLTIDQLPSGAPPSGTEEIPVWQNGQTVKLPIAPVYTNFYVNASTGVDNGPACVSAATPAKTITHAVNIAMSLAAGQGPQYIHMTGAFTECVLVCKQPSLAGNANFDDSPLYFVGVDNAGTTTWNGDSSANGTLVANAGATVAVRNLKISATGTAEQSCLFAQIGGYIGVYDGVIFGTTNAQHLHAENSKSSVQIWDGYTIAGGGLQHVGVATGALVIYAPTSSILVTLTGTPAFTNEFALAQDNGTLYVGQGTSFSGAAIGRRYAVQSNGVIELNGITSETFFPGSIGGVIQTGGQYIGMGQSAPYILAKSAIPFISLSSGSVASGGAITGITALPTTYANAYCYFPANILAASIAAGWYYCTFSGTTTGTAFLNTYTSGTPNIPASPTPVTAGQGSFTGDTGEEFGPTITVPAYIMQGNGMLRAFISTTQTNNSDTKTLKLRYSGNTGTDVLSGLSLASSLGSRATALITNRGVTSAQVASASYGGTGAVGSGVPNTYPAVDNSVTSTLVTSVTKGTATDNIVIEQYLFEMITDGT